MLTTHRHLACWRQKTKGKRINMCSKRQQRVKTWVCFHERNLRNEMICYLCEYSQTRKVVHKFLSWWHGEKVRSRILELLLVS